ncbi:LptA/OstA family protein [Anaerosinus gibii]|uniref:LptA/OstA family protein n=1 Tax=Selenobaculum gibii TaxID=3054208 RepID=A0A9Y2AG43_9FIRM|nr:LptA/OstA family protein [Selenobaculum gbiensis]WIW71050.1 LptA/OstA family protein [Selenobaculum gbiensis]
MNLKKMCLTTMLCMAIASPLYAANDKPIDLSADVIEYDSTTGMMTATGSVKMVQENAVITGMKATYNTKSKEAEIDGGVRMVKEDMDLTAANVRSIDNKHVIAVGDVVLVKGTSTLTGPQVDYFLDQDYVLINSNAKISMPDGVMTSEKLEHFVKENRAVATENVHIVSQTRNLDATGDVATYYGGEGQQGKIVLSGNAVAVQDNNTLRGKTLTMYLEEKPASQSNQSELVIKPNEK